MLPKQHRLRKEKDIKRVMEKGRGFFIKECGLKFLKRKENKETRIGIIVPKKITRTIVRRNKVKRQVRAIFLKIIDDIVPGVDIAFLAQVEFLDLKFADKKCKIISILKKTKLLQ